MEQQLENELAARDIEMGRAMWALRMRQRLDCRWRGLLCGFFAGLRTRHVVRAGRGCRSSPQRSCVATRPVRGRKRPGGVGVKQRTCSSSSGTSAMIAMRAQSASPSASRCCAALAPERTERASGVSSSFFETVFWIFIARDPNCT